MRGCRKIGGSHLASRYSQINLHPSSKNSVTSNEIEDGQKPATHMKGPCRWQ